MPSGPEEIVFLMSGQSWISISFNTYLCFASNIPFLSPNLTLRKEKYFSLCITIFQCPGGIIAHSFQEYQAQAPHPFPIWIIFLFNFCLLPELVIHFRAFNILGKSSTNKLPNPALIFFSDISILLEIATEMFSLIYFQNALRLLKR